MREQKIGIIMNGVTGRMGTNQHLVRSIMAIRRQGGVVLSSHETAVPEPILVGRNENKLRTLAQTYQIDRYSTDLDSCLSDPYFGVYFDAQTTNLRIKALSKAIAAGKHVYCEKPTATNTREALEIYHLAQKAGIKNGVVQDKLWLSGLLKLKHLKDSGFFGRILSVRAEFGYWVFDGFLQPSQRPSWNYRKEAGGGIILDMFAHWRYIIDNLFGEIEAVSCLGCTHIPKRVDEQNQEYSCTAEDAAYATFLCKNGIICQFNSSWAVRVRRDDLVVFVVDGTEGSACAGLRECWIQPRALTPRPVWNPDIENPLNFYESWQKLPDNKTYENAFKVQWELFIKHLCLDSPFPWSLLEGAKGVQLAEDALQSWQTKQWVKIAALE